jgi:hypothetical protein
MTVIKEVGFISFRRFPESSKTEARMNDLFWEWGVIPGWKMGFAASAGADLVF